MVWPTFGSRTAKEQIRYELASVGYFTCSRIYNTELEVKNPKAMQNKSETISK